MEMCILDSNKFSEPGFFVFENSYLNLKITGKKSELNNLNQFLRNIFKTRLLQNRLFVFGSVGQFRSYIECYQEVKQETFIRTLKSILQPQKNLKLPNSKNISFSKPLIMGVINATDDSFFPQSRVLDQKNLKLKVCSMIQDGVDIIDIGGESSRPGATPVDEELEIQRIIPFIKLIREISNIPISVDTYRKNTAKKAIDSGADIINDISAMRFDKEMASFVAINDIPIVMMHMLGKPETMQKKPYYSDVISELKTFFSQRLEFALKKGMRSENIILDPGIGFGKRVCDNLEILKKINLFHSFRLPLLMGASRKSFIGEVLNQKDPMERLAGTMGTTALGVLKGVHIFRVHDVKENRNIADLVFNIKQS